MEPSRRVGFCRIDRQTLDHTVRTAVAAAVSILVARLIKLPEYYWAPITTLVVMQSTLGAALETSGQRFAGTALGAAVGALVAPRFGDNVTVFGLALLAMGLICAWLRMGASAYRFAGITLAIVMLVPRDKPAWVIATNRFVEVSVGIAVGLLVTAIWPQHQQPAPQNRGT
jgi:uncharacterized membrane protein YgaE (UPF0421/DUF939 family)